MPVVWAGAREARGGEDMTLIEFAKMNALLNLAGFAVVCVLGAIGWVALALASRAEHLRYGEGCAGVLTFGELERECATTEVALKIKIEDAVCVVDATFTLHAPDDSAWMAMQVGQALDVAWSSAQGVLL